MDCFRTGLLPWFQVEFFLLFMLEATDPYALDAFGEGTGDTLGDRSLVAQAAVKVLSTCCFKDLIFS